MFSEVCSRTVSNVLNVHGAAASSIHWPDISGLLTRCVIIQCNIIKKVQSCKLLTCMFVTQVVSFPEGKCFFLYCQICHVFEHGLTSFLSKVISKLCCFYVTVFTYHKELTELCQYWFKQGQQPV